MITRDPKLFHYKRTHKKGAANKYEKKLYSLLDDLKIEYEKEYSVKGSKKRFDVYIPTLSILIEIDGDYWHQDNPATCESNIQLRNYKNDLKKNALAQFHNLKLIRIKTSAIDTLTSENLHELILHHS